MVVSEWGGGVGGWVVFFFNDTATTEIYTLSLHDALPIWRQRAWEGKIEGILVSFVAKNTASLKMNVSLQR